MSDNGNTGPLFIRGGVSVSVASFARDHPHFINNAINVGAYVNGEVIWMPETAAPQDTARLLRLIRDHNPKMMAGGVF